jgi:pyridoxamine 5'-phosphate oxidase
MHNPIEAFNAHWTRAVANSPLRQKSAVCVSTIGENGFPNSRFVDLKVADDRGLVFCTYLDSAKGRDILCNPKVGLTVWWDHIGIQARFQGICDRIANDEADIHWHSRSRDAQLTTTTFRQSEPLSHPAALRASLDEARLQHHGHEINRPTNWGGFRLSPVFIELLEFSEDRLHIRTCYLRAGEIWNVSYLQP